jgi:hypothetical protein
VAKKETPTLDRLILRIAANVEEMFTDENGVIDKQGLTAYVKDHFEEDYPDAVDYYHDEAGWKYIWEVIRKNFSDSRSDIAQAEDDQGQFRLMPLEDLDKYVFNVPSGANSFEAKRFPVCSVGEARAVGLDYIQRSRRMAQIGRWVLAHADEAERRGLSSTDLIRDLYRKSA